jgi:nucleoside-diphosphate-sugar epimerase
MKNVAKMIQNMMENPISIKMIKSEDPNYTKDNPQRRCPDLSIIKKSIDYIPKINLEEGLKRIYTWYRSNLV